MDVSALQLVAHLTFEELPHAFVRHRFAELVLGEDPGLAVGAGADEFVGQVAVGDLALGDQSFEDAELYLSRMNSPLFVWEL
ncbi:hypothetical protein [Halostreptopolyspora alba]|uniref:Uncharacterized protein n=1 Tax=Halostreptopolyspora alba TaxID=2487137 RepID=A0A3N0E3Z6_9ACTN|nr:hypothetical protein EFW17_18745 [Nocardiopsaceae bacterium YIM 96095]